MVWIGGGVACGGGFVGGGSCGGPLQSGHHGAQVLKI